MLNLGILAHVDAGKTTLTERLLYAAGVIDEPGDVDDGTTQTDSLELERQRGITIKSAVASFRIGDVSVNLIDTPGHPDFIAEVERALSVLDGAVLVLSAVEGVQPQTRILMRALRRMNVPTIVFINKIDRRGADADRVLRMIEERLTPGAALPVFVGSARTGQGVEALMRGIAELLPVADGDPAAPVSARVFKIERGPTGGKVSYVRMFEGTIHTRDCVSFGEGGEDKVTAVHVFADGLAVKRPAVSAGEIGKLWGLRAVRIGDVIGESPARSLQHHFAPPTLEAVVVPRHTEDRGRLRVALNQLAEQDPFIDVRQDDERREISVSLYGEVQQQVIAATLASDFGLDVDFRELSTIYIERPAGSGDAIEILQDDANPASATVGLRVDPAPVASGIEFRCDVDPRRLPTFVYKTASNFVAAMTEYVEHTLREGLSGWRVTDCLVTMTACGYYASDGPTKPSGNTHRSTAADFRDLTPLVLMTALDRAGTVVCEPIMRVAVEVPPDSVGATLSLVARLGEVVDSPSTRNSLSIVEATMTAPAAQELARRLPGISSGEGVVETTFAGYQPVIGAAPTRRRTTLNPLNRKEYVRQVFHLK